MTELIEKREFNALIKLLDDNDEDILYHVKGKLESLGIKGIPLLEEAWEIAENNIIQERIEELIQTIQTHELKQEFKNWFESEEKDLLKGAILVAKFRYPDLDESYIYSKIKKISQMIWIELHSGLTTLEEAKVINNILFRLQGFHASKENEINIDLGYINKVLENRKGNSISLGILYLSIAQELNIPIYGINLPYHFSLAYCNDFLTPNQLEEQSAVDHVLFYMNPAGNGGLFSKKDIDNYLDRIQLKKEDIHYAPCNNLLIIESLIINQIYYYDQIGEKEESKRLENFYKEVFEK